MSDKSVDNEKDIQGEICMENDELVEEVANQAETLIQLSQNIHASYNKIRYMNKRIQIYEKELDERSKKYKRLFDFAIIYIIEMIIFAIGVLIFFKR